MKVRLTEQELQHVIGMAANQVIRCLTEDFNYHFGKEHNGQPYYSDNKFAMRGRDTGHFGSGTYFSTYKFDSHSDVDTYNAEQTDTPQFIKIRDGVYRVDLDFYKNLYKVPNEQYANVLFTTLENVNNLYNRVANGDYNCSRRYQIIRANCSHIGLECPSYRQLMEMARKHAENDSDARSFSTVFMEMNGYNGVNVSGIFKFDNTLHGSVVYDLSKVEGDMTKASKGDLDRYKYSLSLSSPHDSVVYDSDTDYGMMALNGKDTYKWIRHLGEMNPNQAKRTLKNYTDSGNVLEGNELERLGKPLCLWYLRYLYGRSGRIDSYQLDRLVSDRNFIETVAENKLYYWLNYDGDSSVLVGLMQRMERELFFDNLTDEEEMERMKQYLNQITSMMRRELNYTEEKWIMQKHLR